MSQLTEEERRATAEAQLLDVVCGYGGATIVAGPTLLEMVGKLTDEAEALARRGLLTTIPEHEQAPGPKVEGPGARCPRC